MQETGSDDYYDNTMINHQSDSLLTKDNEQYLRHTHQKLKTNLQHYFPHTTAEKDSKLLQVIETL